VLAPVQQHVGARWEANEWDTADEHAATAVVDGALGALALQAPVRDVVRGRVLVACAEGEHHTMPARMGAELLRGAGWEVSFLGGSMPASDLQRYAGVTQPDAVVISCTVALYLPGARRCFAALAELGLPAMAAGAGYGPDETRAMRLGASGWLGPGVDLAVALDRLAHREPVASPTPAEAIALELAVEDLQRSCIVAMTEAMPQMATYSTAQLASTRTDVGYILGFLVAAIDLGDDAIFGEFVEWLGGVLDARGVPPAVLDRSLEIIGGVLASAGMTDATRLCAGARARCRSG
jgi:methanogenic corrinoid protein MtbC1